MGSSKSLTNRFGFVILGLTNNFAYVVMLSAAYDLLNQSSSNTVDANWNNSLQPQQGNATKNDTQNGYCLKHSTSTILLADTLPSLTIKIFYPMLLVGIPGAYKAIATALLTAAAFIITGISFNQILIFTGVICASLSSGLGESTYLSNTPLYGDSSLSGWSMGTGAAGLVGSVAYALMRAWFSIKLIMLIMLVVPVAMMAAYFFIIEIVSDVDPRENIDEDPITKLSVISPQSSTEERQPIKRNTQNYGIDTDSTSVEADQIVETSSFKTKISQLPPLAKYFLPLLLVYFAEYFINQGLFEIIYFPEVKSLDHAAQYSWFQVTYQVGVMISRSSIDFLKLKNIWAMSLLQCLNAAVFLAHAAKLIHIPSFNLVIAMIVYEGLLGGFTYVNTFYRIKQETAREKQEFNISAVTLADTLGIVIAGLTAIPVHDALCKLYD